MSKEPLHIVLGEDNAGDAALMNITLRCECEHFTLHRAKDGHALKHYLLGKAPFQRRIIPDIILLDLHLPKLDGFDILELINSTPHLLHSYVCILSGTEDTRKREICQAMGAHAFVTKPMRGHECQHMLRHYHERQMRLMRSVA